MRAVVFLADGFEECEAMIVVDILRRAGVETIMGSVTGVIEIDSSRHIKVKADMLAEKVDFNDVDLIILPGGRIGTENLAKNAIVIQRCREFADNKMVAAICAAPSIIANLGLLDGKKATCHPDYEGRMTGAILTHEDVTVTKNIITGQGLGSAFDFAFMIVHILVGAEVEKSIRRAICYNR